MHEQVSPIEELMAVYNRQAEKDKVFGKFIEQYKKHFAKNEELEQARHKAVGTIQQHAAGFQQLLGQANSNPAKHQFF